MSQATSRREFLTTSALGAAALSAARTSVAAPSDPKDVAVWITAGDQRLAAAAPIRWEAAGKTAAVVVDLDPTKKHQEVLGFGASFTDAACFMLNELGDKEREALLHELFHPSEMGLSVCRTCIGSSDYATHLYSYDDGVDPDVGLTRFSIAHDRKYILPMLRQARSMNPELFLLASPWSPPGWMKSNNSMLGGNMQRRYMGSHAQYFVRFIQEYAKEGVPIKAVTVNNEVDTDQDGRMPACLWPQEYEVDFVRNDLGPAFEKAGLSTQIWILDHNYNLWGRALASLSEPNMLKYCQGIAWHGYVGDAARVTQVQEAFPDVGMYWTEGGPDVTNADYATDWVRWGKTFTSNLRNWCRAVTAWNYALDHEGNPNIGPFPCGGLVTVHGVTKEVSYSGQFWAMAQFSSFVKSGAKRIASEGDYSDLFHVAFRNPDGQCVLVITNGSDKERSVALHVSEQHAEVQLAPNSVTTLVW